MTNLSDIVEGWVATLNANYRETTVTAIGNNGTLLTVCSTLWITEDKIVTDSGGNKYKVTSIVFNESITVEPYDGAPVFNDTVVLAPIIQYLHGTPSSVNNEYLNIEEFQMNKTPIVWLLEPYEEEPLDPDSAFDASYNFRLFALEGIEEDRPNDDLNDFALKPMKQLTNFIEDIIDNDYNFRRLENRPSRRPRPRFGVEVSNRGSDRRILDAAMSGYEMGIAPLEVYDLEACKTNC